MAALLDRPGGGPPPVDTDTPPEEYRCTCEGFQHLDVQRMCLRCLDAYTEGLEHADITEHVRTREMRRAAVRLATLLHDDPINANLPLAAAIRAGR